MQETYYFGAGPATLPKSVLKNIALELDNYHGSGISVLELSHRSEEFSGILEAAEQQLRDIMFIPDSHAVLFLHGGASAQYSMLPVNFLHKNERADYICTGHWSEKACVEASKFADIQTIQALLHSDQDDSEVLSVAPPESWGLSASAKYVHYCDNETINGVINDLASNAYFKSKQVELFCDMTSSVLTRPINVQDYGLIYASAQKNLGIAGLCIAIVKKDLLNTEKDNIPAVFDYGQCFEHKSMVNTPPVFPIYVLKLLLEWLTQEGGVSHFFEARKQQANELYRLIDEARIFNNNVRASDRSDINIPFTIKDKVMETEFLQQAKELKLLGLQGHKLAGGVRISLYNAIPQAGVKKLLKFMHDFVSKHANHI